MDDFNWANLKFNSVTDASGSHTLQVGLMDGYGNPIDSLGGAINIHSAGVHTAIINDSFHKHTALTNFKVKVQGHLEGY